MLPARKQRSWDSFLDATARFARPRKVAYLRLGQPAERKAHPRQGSGIERDEHVALILGRICCGAQQGAVRVVNLGGARVVAGRERGAAQPLGELEHRVEPNVAVAGHARVRGLAARVAVDERLDDPFAELLAEVDREVRHAEILSD